MFFETPDEYYQAIGNELNTIIREPWKSIEVEAFLDGISVDIKVVYFRLDGSRESDVDVNMLPEYFYELARATSNEKSGFYKKCFFELKDDGNFNVNFKY